MTGFTRMDKNAGVPVLWGGSQLATDMAGRPSPSPRPCLTGHALTEGALEDLIQTVEQPVEGFNFRSSTRRPAAKIKNAVNVSLADRHRIIRRLYEKRARN